MPQQNAPSTAKPLGAASTQLLAAAAHELKNPIQAMTNILYLLQENPTLDAAGLQHVTLLREELERMRVITANTLGVYRESARPHTVRISDVLDTIVSFYGQKISYKEIAIHKRYASPGLIEAVPAEIRQVFTNLVVNALEAVPRMGKVILHTSPWGRDGVRVTVADNGPGIRPENRQRIFSPSFTTKGEKGSGLGLWVSKGIVDKYRGSIRVRSSVQGNSGTAFSVFFPLRNGSTGQLPSG